MTRICPPCLAVDEAEASTSASALAPPTPTTAASTSPRKRPHAAHESPLRQLNRRVATTRPSEAAVAIAPASGISDLSALDTSESTSSALSATSSSASANDDESADADREDAVDEFECRVCDEWTAMPVPVQPQVECEHCKQLTPCPTNSEELRRRGHERNCQHCGRIFTTSASGDRRPYRRNCPECRQQQSLMPRSRHTCSKQQCAAIAAFGSAAALRRHDIEVHERNEGQPRFACSQCSRWYRNENGLQKHLRRRHRGPDAPQLPFECTECGKRFLFTSELIQHEMSHGMRSGRPECSVCRKLFASSSVMRQHMLLHEGELVLWISLLVYCAK